MVPDATIVSDEDVLAAAETMGAEFSFTEKTTLDVIRVSDDPNAVKGGETYLITRQAGVATRA